MRVLLVEDEESLQKLIKLNLNLEQLEVVIADNGREALKLFENQRFDLIVLDIMLPEMDGFEVCERIRIIDDKVPILFLTAKDSSVDRVKGLKIGGDDYLVKPFNLEELLLRVGKLLKRNAKRDVPYSETVTFGQNEIDFETYMGVNFKGKAIKLTDKEVKLLKLFTGKPNEVISRQQIMEVAWGYDVYPSTRTIDNFVVNLRKYFELNPKQPKHFLSVRGVGYKFVR